MTLSDGQEEVQPRQHEPWVEALSFLSFPPYVIAQILPDFPSIAIQNPLNIVSLNAAMKLYSEDCISQ
jgi:hypothetical protein